MRNKLLMSKEELEKLSKPKLLEHVSDQIEKIDRARGYSSGVSKYQLINYPNNILIEIALTNNEYLIDLNCVQ